MSFIKALYPKIKVNEYIIIKQYNDEIPPLESDEAILSVNNQGKLNLTTSGTTGSTISDIDGHVIYDNGIEMPQQLNLDFVGFTLTNNPETNSTTITSNGGGSSFTYLTETASGLTLKGDFLMDLGSTYNIGSADKPVNSIYADELFLSAQSLYVNGKKVISDESDTINITTDVDQDLVVKTLGLGNTNIISDNDITVKVTNSYSSKDVNFLNESSSGNIIFTTSNGSNIFNNEIIMDNGNFFVNDSNTYISKDVSNNIVFTDINTGSKTLAELAAGSVTSVNTQSGDVVLNTSHIEENGNLYYTESRVSANPNVVANTAKISYPGSASAAELNILDGATITTTELNFLNGTSSNIQIQLNAKAALSHTHTFASLTSRPTTISGYGITDALTLGTTSTTAFRGDYGNIAYTYSQVGHIPLSQLGINNGVATLDGGGKVPSSQLPSAVMEYKGSWNASTNSPTLADGSGNAGDVYIVSVGGTRDLGSGSITFSEGDWVVYDGSIWEKSNNTNNITSVNGQTGVVVLNTTNISEGVNLYYTDARVSANASVVANTAKISYPGSASAAELNILDGAIISTIELNYLDGVTSSVQTQLNSKAASSHTHSYLPLTGGSLTGSLTATSFTAGAASVSRFGGTANNQASIKLDTSNAGSPQISLSEQGDMSWAIGGDDGDNSFKIHGNATATPPTINNLATPFFEITTAGAIIASGSITAASFSGANVTSGTDPGHTHTTYLKNTTDTFTGDLTINIGSLILDGSTGGEGVFFDTEKAPDGFGAKRITYNDGGGNFTIRAGSYYSSGDKFAYTGDGASWIKFNYENSAGSVHFLAASATGTAGNAITSREIEMNYNEFKPTTSDAMTLGTSTELWSNVYTSAIETQEVIITNSSGTPKFKLVYNETDDSLDTIKL